MSYAIQSFQCTELGLQQLQIAKSNKTAETAVTLSEDEVECLLLIQEYRNPNANLLQLSTLEKKFQALYENVNLTRLVVMKLLKFFDVPVQNPNLIQDNPENVGSKPVQEVEVVESNASKLLKKIEETAPPQPKVAAGQKQNMDANSVDPILVVASGSFKD